MNQDEKIIWEAEFNPAVTTYWLTSGILALTLSVVGIPLLPVWIILGKIFTGKYLASQGVKRSLMVITSTFSWIFPIPRPETT